MIQGLNINIMMLHHSDKKKCNIKIKNDSQIYELSECEFEK